MMNISIPYYEDRTRISNSNIGWFLNKGPAFLHKMLTEPPPEESTTAMERGTMIHAYILQPEEFQKDYVVWDKSRPSSAQQEKFCQALAFSTEIEPNRAILSAYKEAYSTRAKSDDLMLSEGLKIASTLKDYIDFLRSNDQRKMISPWDVKMLEKIKQNIQSHKFADKIVWPIGKGKTYSIDGIMKQINSISYIVDETGHPIENIMSFHEFHINWTYYVKMAAGVNCKSLLDGLTLDFRNKKAIIYDLKTTAKLWHFEESIDMHDYLRQLCFYYQAVIWYLKYELKEDPNSWTFKFYIIGIDTTGSYDIRVFKVDNFKVWSRKDTIFDAMKDIMWHQDTGKWEHSREYYEGDGSESLNL